MPELPRRPMCPALGHGILLESACTTREPDATGRVLAMTYLTTEMTSTELRAAFVGYLEGLTCH